MRNSFRLLVFLYVLIFVGYFNVTTSLAKNSEEAINLILQQTSGNVVEYGVKYEFKFRGDGEKLVSDIFSALPLAKHTLDVKVVKDRFQYCIEFQEYNSRGYVQYMKGKDEKIVINFIEEINVENNGGRKLEIEKLVKTKGAEVLCFEYIKASAKFEDKLQTKNIIETVLKKSGASNINSININDGFSITAYTGQGKPMKVGNELIDINCAVQSYESGTYVIIGTPVISTCY